MSERSNAQWVADLSSAGPEQQQALQDLQSVLERTAWFYVRRRLSGQEGIADDEIQALAEDSAQDASLLVLKKLDTFRGEAKFQTWACSFVLRVAMTALRRRLWRDISLDRPPEVWQEPASSNLPSSGWADPQLATQRHAIWDVVRDIVETDLTDRQREVLNLVVIQGVPTEIVEDRLGTSASALYKTTHDARRKLKAGLQKRGFSLEEILSAFEAEP